MGLLVEGVWRDEWYDTAATGGKFERPATSYRNWIEAGGRFSPEAGRYHLYVSWACPWAHRTLIYRKLKGLDDAIGVIYVDPLMLENGWTIGEGVDPITCARFLWQVYAKGYGLHVHHRKPKMPRSTKRITSKKEKISPRIFQTMNSKGRTDPASNLS